MEPDSSTYVDPKASYATRRTKPSGQNSAQDQFIPSHDWQDVPDWAAVPPGGEYRVDMTTNKSQARWNDPVPGPETVVDTRTLPKHPVPNPDAHQNGSIPEQKEDPNWILGRNGETSEEWNERKKRENREEAQRDTRTYIEFLSPSQILAYTPPPDLVLIGDNHLVRGSVTVLAGPPGVGKSRGSLALAEAGATQFEWFGLPVHCTFRTLVIQNENGMSRLQNELKEIDEPRLEQFLRICAPPPYGMCFWRAGFRDQLQRFSDSFGPHVVVLDPWNSVSRDDRAKDFLETFDIIRSVFPPGELGPALVILPHTRKPLPNERANGRALLNLLAGSYVLGSVPRTVFVMQHASDDVSEERIVFTCCKNNDGELGKRSVWIRKNGLFEPVQNFDWKGWDQGEKEEVFTLEQIAEILKENSKGLRRAKIAKEITERGVSRATAYRRIDEAEKAGLIKHQRGSDVYVASA